MVICATCRTKGASPGARQRAADYAAGRARVAVREARAPAHNSAEARRARLELRTSRALVAKYHRELIGDLEGALELAEAVGNAYLAQLAGRLILEAEAYAAEVADADSLEVLEAVLGELRAVREGGAVGELVVFVHRAADEAQRRADLEQRQAEVRRREAEAERQAERKRREAERQAAGQRRQLASAQAGQRSFSGAQAQARRYGNSDELARQLGAHMAQLQARIQRNGACEVGMHLGKMPADYLLGGTVYDVHGWYGEQGRYVDTNGPTVRTCRGHFNKAEQRLKRLGISDVTYQELGA